MTRQDKMYFKSCFRFGHTYKATQISKKLVFCSTQRCVVNIEMLPANWQVDAGELPHGSGVQRQGRQNSNRNGENKTVLLNWQLTRGYVPCFAC